MRSVDVIVVFVVCRMSLSAEEMGFRNSMNPKYGTVVDAGQQR